MGGTTVFVSDFFEMVLDVVICFLQISLVFCVGFLFMALWDFLTARLRRFILKSSGIEVSEEELFGDDEETESIDER